MKTSLTKQLKNNRVNLYYQIGLVFICMVYSLNSSAAETWLTLSPEQCVSVHQGKKCYADVVITWQTVKTDDYCLYSSQQDKPLHCWHNSKKGTFKQEFVSNINISFYLKQKTKKLELANTELKMAWVYKKSSRSHATWRMF